MINLERSRSTPILKPVDPMPADGEPRAVGPVAAMPQKAPRRPPHLRAYGFRRDPFPVVPDLSGFYLSRRNEIIVAEVLHTIENRKGFMVMTGEVGLGKTTLSRRILTELEDRGIQTALVFNTFHQGAELLREINRDFGLELASDDLPAQMAALNDYLLSSLARGVNCAIIIDDAQQLSTGSLELLRQVSNLETDSEKLVQILLIGQPELEATLQSFELRQLESRIFLRHRVQPYTLEETRQYVQLKLMQAAGHGRLQLTGSAFRLLHRLSGGNPRQINILMDRCLYAAIAAGSEKIDRSLLKDAARDTRAAPAREPRAGGGLIAGAVTLLVLGSVILLLVLQPSLARKVWGWAGLGSDPGLAAEPAAAELAAVELAAVELAAVEKVVAPAGSTSPTAPDVPELLTAGEHSSSAHRAAEVEMFLAAYELERYAAAFEDALSAGFVDEVGAQIRLDTGLRLVGLPVALPDGIDGHPVLDLSETQVQGGGYLLFWRPRMWSLPRLYFQFTEGEVLALQEALRRLGHYQGEVDGLAGGMTSRGLRSFQGSVDLPASGMPDTATLFLLEHLSPTPAPASEAREVEEWVVEGASSSPGGSQE